MTFYHWVDFKNNHWMWSSNSSQHLKIPILAEIALRF